MTACSFPPVSRLGARHLVTALLWLLLAPAVTGADSAGVRQWTPTTLAGDLQAGGYLLLVQHAAEGDLPQEQDCTGIVDAETQGRARQLADAMRRVRVPVARVVSADTCVALETARLLDLAPVETDPRLGPVAADDTDAGRIQRLRQGIAVDVPEGEVVVLVSYRSNVSRLLKVALDTPPASVHVLRRLDGRLTYLGVITPADWP